MEENETLWLSMGEEEERRAEEGNKEREIDGNNKMEGYGGFTHLFYSSFFPFFFF